MLSNCDVHVPVGEAKVTTTTIATDALSSCQFFLIDGLYNETPFGYLYHHDFLINEREAASITLKRMLQLLVDTLISQTSINFNSTIDFKNFKNLILFVGGGTVMTNDERRNAFCLLVDPNDLFVEKFLLTLSNDCCHLFRQLVNHTIIIKPVTFAETADADSIPAPDLCLMYDCHSKQGYIYIEWNLHKTLNLASMVFNMHATSEKEYQWKIQSDEIEKFKREINTRQILLQQLDLVLSLVSLPSFFISSPSNLLSPSSDFDGDDKANDINNQESTNVLPASLRIFNCRVNKVVSFKLIRSEEDDDNDDIEFAPEFFHKIFGDKKIIFGYKNLRINIYCLSSSFNFYLNIDYDERINPKKYRQFEADEIIAPLDQWLPSTKTTSLHLFLSKLEYENEYSPFGEQLSNYRLKGEFAPYLIYRVNQNFFMNSKFIDWYSRLEKFLICFVNHASIINKEDPNYIIYLLYQQYENHDGPMCYAIVGFISVYLHYVYPDKRPARISQMLILPPYQRKGHGRRLLTAIYNDLRKDSRVLDITAENPSDVFVALRDLVSLELSNKYLHDIFSKESILKTDRLTEEIIDKTRDVCKLTKQETQRVYEMCLLQSINENNEQQMERFRLLVKQRLFYSIPFDKHHDLQLSDPEMRKTYLTNQYQCIFEHYQNILRTYDKYHIKSFFIADILLR